VIAANQSASNGLSLARASSSMLAGALHMNHDPRCSHEALRNWSTWTASPISLRRVIFSC